MDGDDVVGEEASAQNPELLNVLRSETSCWIVDPIDGTSNFAVVNPDYAVMATYLHNGSLRSDFFPTSCAPIWRLTDVGLVLPLQAAPALESNTRKLPRVQLTTSFTGERSHGTTLLECSSPEKLAMMQAVPTGWSTPHQAAAPGLKTSRRRPW